VQRAAKPQGIDAVVSTVPADDLVPRAMTLLNGGGKLLLFAHTRRDALAPVDLATVCVGEKDLLGSYSAELALQEKVARMVFTRKLDVRRLITHCFSLENALQAICSGYQTDTWFAQGNGVSRRRRKEALESVQKKQKKS